MESLLILLLVFFSLVAVVWGLSKSKQDKERQQKKEGRIEVFNEYVQKAQKYIDKAYESKSSATKINNYKKALDILLALNRYDDYRELSKDSDKSVEILRKAIRVMPIIEYVTKASKHRFKGNTKQELAALQDALYEIRMKNISNEELTVTDKICSDDMRPIITIESMVSRLAELGWTEERLGGSTTTTQPDEQEYLPKNEQ